MYVCTYIWMKTCEPALGLCSRSKFISLLDLNPVFALSSGLFNEFAFYSALAAYEEKSLVGNGPS
jgi:hypothetical protein